MRNSDTVRSGSSRMPQLDGLRALAVASVAVAHWWVPYPLGLPAGSGVHLFFVISGFLITGILLDNLNPENSAEKNTFVVRSFFARRVVRIFPLYYATLAVAFILNIYPVRETIHWNAFYLTNFYLFFHGAWHGAISHLWSLAVEEQFYIFWPFLLLLAPRRKMLGIIAFLIVVAPLFRLAMFYSFPEVEDKYVLTLLPVSCFDSLGVGALIAAVMRQDAVACSGFGGGAASARPKSFQRQTTGKLTKLMLLVGLPGFAITWYLYRNSIFTVEMLAVYPTFLAMCFGWLVHRASAGFSGIGKLFQWRPLVYLGTISYGLYVFHYFAPWFVYWLLSFLHFSPQEIDGIVRHQGLHILLLITVTVIGAVVSWHCFESPLNKLKRFFPYQKAIAAQKGHQS